MIFNVSTAMKLGVIDVHGSLEVKDEMIADNVHPNSAGARVIAATVFKALTGKDALAAEAVTK